MWILALIFTLGFVLVVFYRKHISVTHGEGLPLPPGSMGLPFLGETLQYVTPFKSSTLGPFLEQRITRYGDVFKSHIFGNPTIVTTKPELNQFIMQNEGKLFKCSYPAGFVKIVGDYNILQIHGTMHKKIRQLGMGLLGFEKLSGRLLVHMEKQVIRSLKEWKDGSLIRMKDETANMTFIVLMNDLISLDSESEETQATMALRFSDFMAGLCALPIALPGTTYTKCLKSRDEIVICLKNIIAKRRMERSSETKDFLDTVLEYQRSEGEEVFSDKVIVDFLFAFLLAGYDTTSIVMTMAVKYLTENPEALSQLRREHESIIMKKKKTGETCLNWEDYKSMEFTRNVMKETLRLANVGPFLYRECIKETQIKGYRIPKGWKVIASTMAVSLDPEIFPDPSAFNPWRWHNSTKEQEKSLQVFGGGLRYCLGADLAKLEIAVFLHHLVTKFSWVAADKNSGEITCSPLVTFKNGYPIRIRRIQNS